VVPPTKISPATGKTTWAFGKTDEGFKALLDHHNPKVQAIVAARMGVKSTLEETRTERFIKIADRGTLPVPLRYYAAHTGRWGGDDKINLQNLPRKSPLKSAMLAPKGYVLIDCDSSQIEARTLAWLAGQNDLVEAFDKGEDVYRIMASSIYGVPVEEVTDAQRFVGKTTILGAGYGMGAVKFRAQLNTFGVDLSEGECKRIISVYRSTYPMIPWLWNSASRTLQALKTQRTCQLGCEGALTVDLLGIKLPNGMYVRYPNLREDADGEMIYDTKRGRTTIPTRIYGGKVIENVCQALARIVIGEQMLMVARRLRVVMTVHDAVGAIAPIEEAGEARNFVEQCMRMRPKWAAGLPLNCESKMGASYGG
jgi:DNA polymerase